MSFCHSCFACANCASIHGASTVTIKPLHIVSAGTIVRQSLVQTLPLTATAQLDLDKLRQYYANTHARAQYIKKHMALRKKRRVKLLPYINTKEQISDICNRWTMNFRPAVIYYVALITGNICIFSQVWKRLFTLLFVWNVLHSCTVNFVDVFVCYQ